MATTKVKECDLIPPYPATRIKEVMQFYAVHEDFGSGLCSIFTQFAGGNFMVPYHFTAHARIPKFLSGLGGRSVFDGWYWPITPQGMQQRLIMLAFWLTWLGDVPKPKRSRR